MKCPHCGKDTEPPEVKSPEGLLHHVKSRVHQNVLALKRCQAGANEGYSSETRKNSIAKWTAWQTWLEEQINDKEENQKEGS